MAVVQGTDWKDDKTVKVAAAESGEPTKVVPREKIAVRHQAFEAGWAARIANARIHHPRDPLGLTLDSAVGSETSKVEDAVKPGWQMPSPWMV
jgi:hypothetical protein